jgi:hypothetical protein
MKPLKKHVIQLSGHADTERRPIVVHGHIVLGKTADQDRIEARID